AVNQSRTGHVRSGANPPEPPDPPDSIVASGPPPALGPPPVSPASDGLGLPLLLQAKIVAETAQPKASLRAKAATPAKSITLIEEGMAGEIARCAFRCQPVSAPRDELGAFPMGRTHRWHRGRAPAACVTGLRCRTPRGRRGSRRAARCTGLQD